ncbi:MAG: tetratricopeptide repeat protein [Bacteroides sp.]|uniref:tetratricopeptide repeat protein n=1 Tax=Bacteroides sp. TaxID=29523 RepID=UPI002FC63643
MTSANLQQWIQHPETLNKETLYELRTCVTRYPYFQSARLLYLKNLFLLHDITFGSELRKTTLYVADRRALFYLIEGDKHALQVPHGAKPAFIEEKEEEPGFDRTLSLIDAFLATVPEELSQQISLDYTTDYTSYLLQSDEVDESDETTPSPKLRGQELIDGFIEKSDNELVSMRMKSVETEELPSVTIHEATVEESSSDVVHLEEDEDDSCFTETLAKIYVKQQRYSKALEIIKKLSLKYPKKNGYFADQIRFLEKLIINAKSK